MFVDLIYFVMIALFIIINISFYYVIKTFISIMISSSDNEIPSPLVDKNEEDPQNALINFIAEKETLITHDFYIQGVKVDKSYFNCSIYSDFTSETFNIHNVVYYLGKQKVKGATDVLMNLLCEKFINKSFFYLPQLIVLFSSNKYSKPIETFLLDRCIGQMKFSIIINWLVTSSVEDLKKEGKKNKKFEKLQNRIETTLVNGRRCTLSSYTLYKLKRQDTQYQIFKGSLDKEQRLNYFNQVMIFYTTLKALCMKLKEYPRETIPGQEKQNRNYVMRESLKKYNKSIREMYNKTFGGAPEIKNDLNNFFRGILLPFNDSEEVEDEFNNLIVRLIPEHSMCFSTKARVPVKLVVECIRMGECKDWNEKYIKEDDTVDKENEEEEKKEKEKNDETKKARSKTKANVKNETINNYNSIDDFFTTVEQKDKEYERKERERKNVEEINKILSNVQYANEHPELEGTFPFGKMNSTTSNSRGPSFRQRNSVSYTQTNNNGDDNNEEFLCESTSLDQNPFGKKWSEITSSIQEKSPFRKFETYSIKTFIAKADDDLRQEVMTMQMIQEFDKIFSEDNTGLKLKPYEILVTSSCSGLVEFLPNTISIDGLKKKIINTSHNTLNSFFRFFFSTNLEEAQKNFAASLAAYSVVSYIINIKDRHNGNILLDMNGNIIHIDFGFILGISPGNMNFETAPFKLTTEYVDILDGEESPLFDYYKTLMVKGFMAARKHYETFETIVYSMANGGNSNMPCFAGRPLGEVMRAFKERFHFEVNEFDYMTVVNDLVKAARTNWRTYQYDVFQKLTNGILP